jgi:hypothetical protein
MSPEDPVARKHSQKAAQASSQKADQGEPDALYNLSRIDGHGWTQTPAFGTVKLGNSIKSWRSSGTLRLGFMQYAFAAILLALGIVCAVSSCLGGGAKNRETHCGTLLFNLGATQHFNCEMGE